MFGSLMIIASIICGMLCFIIKNKYIFILQTSLVIVSIIILLIAFITSDFSFQTVLFYSSTKKPLIYKIAGLWTSHNASILFWTGLLSLITMIATIVEKDSLILSINTKIYSGFLSIMTLFIYFASNPFFTVPNPPKEGLGLNPVLQDIAVSIHPPILYLGYVTYIIPFAYSISMLLIGKLEKSYLEKSLFFSKLALAFLSFGIALGSWWAYRELGWGGYWFFDPVENVSLLPWLVGIALHHSLHASIHRSKMVETSIFLGLLNFILVILGMMLVRSGSLLSVHAFATNIAGGKYIIGAFIISIIALVTLYLMRIDAILASIKSVKSKLADRVIVLGSILLLLAALSIFIGILYPVIFQMMSKVSITIDNGYFHMIFLPLGGIIAIITLFALVIDRNSHDFKIISLIQNKNTAMIISHLGIGVLVIGIILNSILKKDIEFIGSIGDKKTVGNIEIKLQNIKYADGPNYYRQIAELWINHDREITILKPENRLYFIEDLLSAESDIYSFVSKDIYAVLGQVKDSSIIYANIYIRPWMSLIWLGMFMTASGVLISAISRKSLL